MVEPVIAVHGGAGRIGDGREADAQAGVEAAVRAGQAILVAGGDAREAVVAAVRVLEDDPTFNAGRGACMNVRGHFETDAGIMVAEPGPGGALHHGAVAAVPELADPIVVAEALLHTGPHRLLAAQGAVEFAKAQGIGRFGAEHLHTDKAQARYEAAMADLADGHRAIGQADTVGAVALDAQGGLCSGNSTGGVLLKAPGRVGDSPLVGVGFYAAGGLGAAGATGVGEAIMTHVASHAVLLAIAAGEEPNEAAARVCTRVAAGDATCGIIVVTPDGRTGVAHRSPHMSWAVARGETAPTSGVTT